MLQSLVRGHLAGLFLGCPSHGDLPMNTTAAHNAKVNADRGAENLVTLIEKYADEDSARAYLEGLRWPEKPHCPRCDSVKVSRIRERAQLDCDSCRYQFSVTSGTVLHDTHLPLWKW